MPNVAINKRPGKDHVDNRMTRETTMTINRPGASIGRGIRRQKEIADLEEFKKSQRKKPGTKRSARNTLNGVTVKQENFIQCVLDGMTYSDAYRNSYDISPDTKDTTVHVSACKLMQNPNVKKRMQFLEAEKEELRRMQGQSMHARVIDRLEREANDKKNPPAVRVRALELLGKTVGAFKDVSETTVKKGKTIKDLELELQSMLAAEPATASVDKREQYSQE